jgi:hypothetical protein
VGSEVLDIVIGLVGVYVFLSLICTTVKELIAQFTRQRAETLLTGLRRLLDGEFDAKNTPLRWLGGVEGKVSLSDLGDTSLVKKLYDHHLIRSHAEGGEKPSYIPADTFATALLDLLASGEEARTIESVRGGIEALPEDLPVRSALLSILDEAGDDLDAFRENLKTWYNNSMDRVAAFYKKHTQLAVLVIAAVTAGLTNADTLQMARQLSRNDVLRQAAAEQALSVARSERLFPDRAGPTGPDAAGPSGKAADTSASPRRSAPPDSVSLDALARRTEEYISEYNALGLPIGWGRANLPSEDATTGAALQYWISKVLGLLMTALAISLGAPFWFDVLRNVSTIRSSGRSPD